MPKKKARTAKSISNEINSKRARSYIAHAEYCDNQQEAAIIRRALDHEAGAEWYLHILMDKSKASLEERNKLHAEIKELEKEAGGVWTTGKGDGG